MSIAEQQPKTILMSQFDSEPIAVIGMALRVPGANSLEQFWENIINGKDCLSRPTAKELRIAGIDRSQLADPHFIRTKPLLDNVDEFDSAFFDMAAYETERTDPGHRLFLECAWQALENAAVVPGTEKFVTGIYGGVESWYQKQNLNSPQGNSNSIGYRVENLGEILPDALGNVIDYFTTRVSYKLNLNGPSISVMAACATSLVAVHMATQALRRRECNLALAGGAGVEIPHIAGYMSTVDGMLSESGRICPFDSNADGTIFGSGGGVVVLRPLEDAIADGNNIYATIKGTATLNDGAPIYKESFIAPSTTGQKAVVRAALDDANVNAESIEYLEAHGTATRLGDPVEVASITEVYRNETEKVGYCAIGSVKSNVGHLRTAAGVVSLIKTCLAIKKRRLPPLTNFSRRNPLIDLDSSPFYIPTESLEWSNNSTPRRAAVSAFGFGGSNAHLILQEFSATQVSGSSRQDHLLVFSAATASSLDRRVSDLAWYIEVNPDECLSDIAHTLQCGRTEMAHRCCFITRQNDFKPLDLIHEMPLFSGVVDQNKSATIFLFPGQGAQFLGMGQNIYTHEKFYRDVVDYCAEHLHKLLGLDIRTLIHIDQTQPNNPESELLQQTANTQPALFVVEYAMAKLFMSWGIEPTAIIGHSIGEIVAACLANVFSLDDALVLVANRAKLMQQCDPGKMAAVFQSESELLNKLDFGVEIAAVNGPNACVVSGSTEQMAQFLEKLNSENVITHQLKTSHGFHSWMMEPAIPGFRSVVNSMELNRPEIPIISNTTGLPLTDDQATNADYWAEHIRRPVRLSDSIDYVRNNFESLFLELGPGTGLSDLVKQHDSDLSTTSILDTKSTPQKNNTNVALAALGKFWCSGANIHLDNFYSNSNCKKLTLPGYPFERLKYWAESGESKTRSRTELKLYETGWRKQEIENSESRIESQTWLVFRDEVGLGQKICDRLKADNNRVVELIPGQAFSEIEADVYRIRPTSKEDMKSVLLKLKAGRDNLTPRVLHLWSVTGTDGEHNSIEAFKNANTLGYHSIISLIKAALDLKICDDFDISIVVDGLRQMPGESTPLHAEKGGLLGPVKNIPNELSGTTIRCIEISGFSDLKDFDRLVGSIIIECESRTAQNVVLHRPGGRYVEEIYPLKEFAISEPRIRHRGTVLITGGVGYLGLEISKELYSISNCRLVLTSRWQPPPRDEWNSRAKESDKIGFALKAILTLESMGAEVLVVHTDVTNIDSLKSAIVIAENYFSKVNGVVHCAGESIISLAHMDTQQNVDQKLCAKVHTAFNLEKIFADYNLDIFVNFSSQASVLPSVGQCAYSASNNVLDILSHKRSRDRRSLSCAIGFGPLEELGMAVNAVNKNRNEIDRTDEIENFSDGIVEFDHPLLSKYQTDSNDQTIFTGIVADDNSWYLNHRVQNHALLPGTFILECVRGAYVELRGKNYGVELSNVGFLRPLFIDTCGTEIEIKFFNDNNVEYFEVRSRVLQADYWIVNSTGAVKTTSDKSKEFKPPLPMNLVEDSVWQKNGTLVSFGNRWECVEGIVVDGDQTWGKIILADEYISDLNEFEFHPALIDRAVHVPCWRFFTEGVLPYTMKSMRIFDAPGKEFYVYGNRRRSKDFDVYDIKFVNDKGKVLVEIDEYLLLSAQATDIVRSDCDQDNIDVAATNLLGNQFLKVYEPGELDSIGPENFEPKSPETGEVQIDVIASGLNFRDLLSALGQYPLMEGEQLSIGGECAGIVNAVGPGNTDLSPGDFVIAIGNNTISTSITTRFDLVSPMPSNIPFEDAAGLPTIFLTADYVINELAKLKRGERILIHAASGGVGLAAIQYAKNIGAEIFATAGSEEKRNYLKQLGIEHVSDSRSLDFVDDIRSWTNDEGVDVVLNSLAGEFIPASLELLRYKGRFLEIGKRDIYSNTELGLLPFQKCLTYHAFDLGQLVKNRDPAVQRMLNKLVQDIEFGVLKPAPTTVIPIDNAIDGFKRLARAAHIGKNVFKIQKHPDSWQEIFKAFNEKYGKGVPLKDGMALFRSLVSRNHLPSYVLATGLPIDQAHERMDMLDIGRGSRPELETAYREPTDPEEINLTQIWENVLGVTPIGADDDFFDLGGDSITAIQAQFAVTKKYNIDLPVTALFDFPSVCKMSQKIRESTTI